MSKPPLPELSRDMQDSIRQSIAHVRHARASRRQFKRDLRLALQGDYRPAVVSPLASSPHSMLGQFTRACLALALCVLASLPAHAAGRTAYAGASYRNNAIHARSGHSVNVSHLASHRVRRSVYLPTTDRSESASQPHEGTVKRAGR